MDVYVLVIMLGVVSAQVAGQSSTVGTGFPPECQTILNNGIGTVTYPPTSVANSLNTFCPVIDEFTDCLERNLDLLRNSSTGIHADTFNKAQLRLKMSMFCSSLPDIASELECLLNDTEITSCIEQQRRQVQQQGALSLETFCSIMINTTVCLRRSSMTVCPQSVVEVYIQYLNVYVPDQCNYPTIATSSIVHSDIDSVFIRCVAVSFPVILGSFNSLQPADIARTISEYFEDICRNRSAFADCINRKFNPPFSPIDSIIAQFLNKNGVGTSLDQLCKVSISSTEQTCLQDSLIGMTLCGNVLAGIFQNLNHGGTGGSASDNTATNPNFVMNTGGSFIEPMTATHAPPDYIQLFCPAIHSVNKCVRIQLQRCSTHLSQAFMSAERQLLTPECISAVSPLIENSPLSSVVMFCGLQLGGEIFQRVSAQNLTTSRDKSASDLISDLIPVSCGFSGSFTSCVADEIANSDNLYDKIALRFLDLTDGTRLERVISSVCDETTEIQNNLVCLLQNLPANISSCVSNPKYKEQFGKYIVEIQRGNLTALNVDSIKDLCGPMKEIGLCTSAIIGNCNQEIGQTSETVVNELLRTDCGGTRPLTGNPNSASHYIPQKFLLYFFFLLFVLIFS